MCVNTHISRHTSIHLPSFTHCALPPSPSESERGWFSKGKARTSKKRQNACQAHTDLGFCPCCLLAPCRASVWRGQPLPALQGRQWRSITPGSAPGSLQDRATACTAGLGAQGPWRGPGSSALQPGVFAARCLLLSLWNGCPGVVPFLGLCHRNLLLGLGRERSGT